LVTDAGIIILIILFGTANVLCYCFHIIECDYHTLDFNDKESDSMSVEVQLSKLESEQSALARVIRETKKIEASQIESLSTFVSLMQYRVPAW
jgi:hypothetical protein